jgi:hypothetical protein
MKVCFEEIMVQFFIFSCRNIVYSLKSIYVVMKQVYEFLIINVFLFNSQKNFEMQKRK